MGQASVRLVVIRPAMPPTGIDASRLVDATSPPSTLQTLPIKRAPMAKKDTFRIVTRGTDGNLLIRDYMTCDPIIDSHLQIGTDDCSTDLELRGMPVFRGLIGPMPEGKNVVRYESPEVFESLTKEWGAAKPRRRTRRPSKKQVETAAVAAS